MRWIILLAIAAVPTWFAAAAVLKEAARPPLIGNTRCNTWQQADGVVCGLGTTSNGLTTRFCTVASNTPYNFEKGTKPTICLVLME
jgi:hypothetical protein